MLKLYIIPAIPLLGIYLGLYGLENLMDMYKNVLSRTVNDGVKLRKQSKHPLTVE